MRFKREIIGRPVSKRERSILASQQARRLDKLGMSETMWERLAEVYQARLNRARGLVRSATDPTLCALYQRGLVQHGEPSGEELSVCTWTTTETGKAMTLEGPE